jgi:hypothetical protein
MRSRCVGLLAAVLVLGLPAGPAFAREPQIGDDQIRQRIISESIASYPGVCACPYSAMRNGHSCGGRSAYSRPGGYSPLCYAGDVSADMIARYRTTRGL